MQLDFITKIFRFILKKTTFKRRTFFFISDILLISTAMYASFWCRFNGAVPDEFKKTLPYFILLALGIKLFFLILYNLYDISWRFVSLEESVKVFKALSLGTLTLGMSLYFLRLSVPFKVFPRSILLIDYVFSLILIGSLRISKRMILEGIKSTLKSKKEKVKVLIIGAGSAGEQIIREMIRNKKSNYLPIGFVDDDPAKQGIKIHGVKILGRREDIPDIIKNDNIDEVLIALPSAHSRDIREIVKIIKESKCMEIIKILPSTTDLIDGRVSLSDIHKVELEDLLGRAPVKIDLAAIKDFINNKNVLITGAGGSIGSELAKAIISFDPKNLVILDIDETELFYLVNKIKYSKANVIPVIGDIKNETKMEAVYKKYSPQIVFHSAAYKHVPILEFFPEEAVKTNIYGTEVLAELSLKYDVEKFIFISTDKAINPTSVMGATKRCGEEMIKFLNQKNTTKFISVRFGNVLGSRGSVIPLFEEQIRKGGPVTVTHPEMKRYFMITSEAVLLVLEASAIGKGSEVFVLDMGEPIKIVDLAEEMIRLSGYEPDVDIPIVFSHVRAGEKLFEEILSAEEGTEETKYEKIFIARDSKEARSKDLIEKIKHLIEMSDQDVRKDEIVRLLREIVPTYTPAQNKSPINSW